MDCVQSKQVCATYGPALVLFWFPTLVRRWQTEIEAALTLAACGGLVLLIFSQHPFAGLIAPVLIAHPAVYYIILVSPRYRFPLEPFLFLLSAHFLIVAGSYCHRRLRGG
jgi:hypothetical protein